MLSRGPFPQTLDPKTGELMTDKSLRSRIMSVINTFTMNVNTPRNVAHVDDATHETHACGYRCKGGFRVKTVRGTPACGLTGSSFVVQCTGGDAADCNAGGIDGLSDDNDSQAGGAKPDRAKKCGWFMKWEWVRDVQGSKFGWAVRDMNLTHDVNHQLLVVREAAMYNAVTRPGRYALKAYEDDARRLHDNCYLAVPAIHRVLQDMACQRGQELGWTVTDVRRLLSSSARRKQNDLTKLHQVVLQRQQDNLVADVMYDEDDTLTGVFVEMRGAYEVAKKYGMGNLVATIDATHETNAFGFKLVDVVVTDHNNIIRCMAVAVIKTENVEAFRFVLKNFSKCFGSPRVLMSDSDASIATAISLELPHTLHLLCVFHLLLNLRTNVRSLFKIDGGRSPYDPAWKKTLHLFWKLVHMTDLHVLQDRPAVVDEAFDEMRSVITNYAASKSPSTTSAQGASRAQGGANPKDKKSGLDKALDMIERLRKNQKKFVGVYTWAAFTLGRLASSNSESWHNMIKQILTKGSLLLHELLERIDAMEAQRADASRQHDIGLCLPENRRQAKHKPKPGLPLWLQQCEEMLSYHGITVLHGQWLQSASYQCQPSDIPNCFSVTRDGSMCNSMDSVGSQPDGEQLDNVDRVPDTDTNLDCWHGIQRWKIQR